jgi:hypothetical protein
MFKKDFVYEGRQVERMDSTMLFRITNILIIETGFGWVYFGCNQKLQG